MTTCIGIDFGTTYTRVAILKNNEPVVVDNCRGRSKTPSVVACKNGECFIGKTALKSGISIRNIIFEPKRLIGKTFDDSDDEEQFLADKEHWLFRVSRVENRPCYILDGSPVELLITPKEVTGIIFRKLKEHVQAKLNNEIESAVITVPHSFSNYQRAAIRKAAIKYAKFRQVKLLEEQKAAAIAYGRKNIINHGYTLIFDLGGGECKISLLNIWHGSVLTISSAKGIKLGSREIDKLIFDYVVDEFQKSHGFDIRADPNIAYRLRKKCIKAKEDLSYSKDEVVIYIDNAYRNMPLRFIVHRDILYNGCEEYFRNISVTINTVIRNARLSVDKIDKVIVVGESAHFAKIEELLALEFGGDKIYRDSYNEVIVSYGAAIASKYIIYQGIPIQMILDDLRYDIERLSNDLNQIELSSEKLEDFKRDIDPILTQHSDKIESLPEEHAATVNHFYEKLDELKSKIEKRMIDAVEFETWKANTLSTIDQKRLKIYEIMEKYEQKPQGFLIAQHDSAILHDIQLELDNMLIELQNENNQFAVYLISELRSLQTSVKDKIANLDRMIAEEMELRHDQMRAFNRIQQLSEMVDMMKQSHRWPFNSTEDYVLVFLEKTKEFILPELKTYVTEIHRKAMTTNNLIDHDDLSNDLPEDFGRLFNKITRYISDMRNPWDLGSHIVGASVSFESSDCYLTNEIIPTMFDDDSNLQLQTYRNDKISEKIRSINILIEKIEPLIYESLNYVMANIEKADQIAMDEDRFSQTLGESESFHYFSQSKIKIHELLKDADTETLRKCKETLQCIEYTDVLIESFNSIKEVKLLPRLPAKTTNGNYSSDLKFLDENLEIIKERMEKISSIEWNLKKIKENINSKLDFLRTRDILKSSLNKASEYFNAQILDLKAKISIIKIKRGIKQTTSRTKLRIKAPEKMLEDLKKNNIDKHETILKEMDRAKLNPETLLEVNEILSLLEKQSTIIDAYRLDLETTIVERSKSKSVRRTSGSHKIYDELIEQSIIELNETCLNISSEFELIEERINRAVKWGTMLLKRIVNDGDKLSYELKAAIDRSLNLLPHLQNSITDRQNYEKVSNDEIDKLIIKLANIINTSRKPIDETRKEFGNIKSSQLGIPFMLEKSLILEKLPRNIENENALKNIDNIVELEYFLKRKYEDAINKVINEIKNEYFLDDWKKIIDRQMDKIKSDLSLECSSLVKKDLIEYLEDQRIPEMKRSLELLEKEYVFAIAIQRYVEPDKSQMNELHEKLKALESKIISIKNSIVR